MAKQTGVLFESETPNYRFIAAPGSPLGFSALMQQGRQWVAVDTIPVYAIRPLLIQAGLLNKQAGMMTIATSGATANGSGAIRRARSGTTKVSTSRTV